MKKIFMEPEVEVIDFEVAEYIAEQEPVITSEGGTIVDPEAGEWTEGWH